MNAAFIFDGQERQPSEGEAWFDSEIAPQLLALADLCRERGMSFINVVEFAPGERASTVRMTDGAGAAMEAIKKAVEG